VLLRRQYRHKSELRWLISITKRQSTMPINISACAFSKRFLGSAARTRNRNYILGSFPRLITSKIFRNLSTTKATQNLGASLIFYSVSVQAISGDSSPSLGAWSTTLQSASSILIGLYIYSIIFHDTFKPTKIARHCQTNQINTLSIFDLANTFVHSSYETNVPWSVIKKSHPFITWAARLQDHYAQILEYR